jgi:transcriptional regulator with GAF, ATPase, and Fis domain
MPDMTDKPTVTMELIQQLEQGATELKQLEAILQRLMQVLTESGFQVSVDLVGLVHTQHERIDKARKQAKDLGGQLDQTSDLLRMFTLITSSLELDQVLQEVMDTVITLTGAERAYLVLINPATQELEITVARNWDRESLTEAEAQFSRSVVNQALKDGKAIVTTNAATDDRFLNAASVVNNQLRSILCIPLIVAGRAQGVLYADNRVTQDIFKGDKIPLLTAFGTQAAVAIANARLYGQVKEDLTKALTELQSLQIAVDRSKLDRQVSEITETDYFQKLSVSARTMRGRYRSGDE